MVPIEHMFPLYMCIEMYANTGRRKMAIGREEAKAGPGLLSAKQPPDSKMMWLSAGPQLPNSRLLSVQWILDFFFSFSHLQSKFVYCNFFFVNYLP